MIRKIELLIDTTKAADCLIPCLRALSEIDLDPTQIGWPAPHKRLAKEIDSAWVSIQAEVATIERMTLSLEEEVDIFAVVGVDELDPSTWGNGWRIKLDLLSVAAVGLAPVERLIQLLNYAQHESLWFYIDEEHIRMGGKKASFSRLLAYLERLATFLRKQTNEDDDEDDVADEDEAEATPPEAPATDHAAYFLHWLQRLGLPQPKSLADLEKAKRHVFKAAHPDARPGAPQANHEFHWIMQGYILLKKRLGDG